jgi:stress response protein YsnF
MITREEIANVLDHPVYDGDGNKIGDAKHVFFDDVTGRPEWVSVKTGMFGSSESFVPIRDASLVQDHIEVPYGKEQVKGAPNVDVDAGGHLSESEEHRLYDYYGINWDSVLSEAERTDDGRWAAGPGHTGAGAAGAAGAAGMAGTTGRTADTEGRTTGTEGRMAGTAGGAAGYQEARDRTGLRDDDAMTRSEEQMHVGVERRESGRARLRKYVVTEEVQQTVPVTHEEVRVEREPITEANRDDALAGPEISEAEHEITLHAERPVVETETVPVERVRMTTEEHTEEETVRGQVRKERIEAVTEEIPEDDDIRRGRE